MDNEAPLTAGGSILRDASSQQYDDSDVSNRRASFASTHNSFNHDEEDDMDVKEPHRKKPPKRKGSSLEDALSDSNSKLAQFLLCKGADDEEDRGLFDDLLGSVDDAIFSNPMMKSIRNLATRIVTGENGAKVNEKGYAGSLGTSKAWFYSLALEPMEIRSERIVMLAEAYAIFGALFLTGTFILYEWGSALGYGGCDAETSYCHPNINRAFEAVMALAITANLFQAMFSSFLWLMSILFSANHRNWVYGARHLLLLCHVLICCILVFTVCGVGLGLYAKFAGYWPEVGITLSFLLLVVGYGMWSTAELAANEIPLEYYHFPLWFKLGLMPSPLLRRGARQHIRTMAEKRAKDLKSRAWKEKSLGNSATSFLSSSTIQRSSSSRNSIGYLLRKAANAIGRGNVDVSKYEERLADEWYDNTDQLRGMNIDILNKYMPRRLAEEVYNQLLNEAGELKTSHIASGSVDNEHRVSWNLHDDDSE